MNTGARLEWNKEKLEGKKGESRIDNYSKKSCDKGNRDKAMIEDT